MKLEDQEEVVISGIGGYFPKCTNIDQFKNALLSNESLLETRWKAGERGVSNRIGKVEGIDLFDGSYFGIHREQCNFMDPMQRMVLERTFEALIDAGVNPVDIRGKKVAVYCGSTVGENDNLFYESIVSGFGITGHSRSMMPNRVSYWLNLKGPSCAYDNNWLNGCEVLQAAYDTIRHGYCDSAIIATANLALNSELSWVYNDMGLLSPEGDTRAFDANANGYGRSDGIIVMYIQRACEAKRSYATILGVDSRFNGNREGSFRDLDLNSLTNFIDEFYANCKVDPRDVEFLECYGCGLKHIDETELTAVDRVYCKDRKTPLLIGSVKSNAGHAEASCMLVSVAKVLIAMESGIIPANICYEKPNPNISGLVDGRMQVVTENKKWNGGLIAVNGIGLASSYGHILLKANPKITKPPHDELPRLVTISTRAEEGIQEILSSLKSKSKVEPEYAALIQETFKKTIPGHLYRGYAVLDGSDDAKSEFEYYPGNKRQIWFVYSGMGSQWCKMATDLMVLPIFAEAIHKCHKILEPRGIDLLKIVTHDDAKMFENILHSFVGIAAVQIGLTDVLRSLNIVPDGMIGHSVGELGCAYADGCFTAEQMILSAYSRGKASIEANLIRGMMAAVGKGYQQMKDECPPSIEVACHNGADSCTISGPTEDMEVFVKQLQDKGIFARLVNVSNIAYHSRYIKPAAPLLLKYLKEVIPNPLPRSSKWISTSVPEDKWDTDLAKTSSPDYHTNNLLSSVLFEEGSKHIPKEAIVIEIAPHGLLQAILKRSLKSNCTNIPLTHRTSKNGLQFLLGAIGKMYLSGMDLNISALYHPIEYPVSRGIDSLTPLIHWEHSDKWRAGLEDKLNYLASVRDLNISLKSEDYRDLIGHQLKNTVIIPTSTYLTLIHDILTGTKIEKLTDVVFENMKFKNVIRVPKTGSIPLYIMVQKGSGDFEISSGNELIGSGVIRIPESERMFSGVEKIEITEDSLELTGNDVYSEFYHRGYKYAGNFKVIKHLDLTMKGSLSKVRWSNSWSYFIEAMLQLYLFRTGEHYQNISVISAIQRIVMSLPLLPTEPTDLEVTYEYATGIIATKGLQICGVQIKSLTLENRPISCDSVELTPLNEVVYENIESGINLGFNLVMDNFDKGNTYSIMIVEVETSNPIFEENIKNVMNKHTHISANISLVKDAKMILISQTEPLYIIINNKVTEDCVKLLASSHVFLLAQTDKNILSYPQIVQVAQFSVNGISYSLLRKCSQVKPVIINVKADTLSSKDFSRENLSWVSQLKSAVATAQEKVYLAASVIPLEGIKNFVQDVRAMPNMHNVRFAFLLDKKAPEFTPKEPVYQRVFKQDLSLIIVKDDSISSLIHIPTEFKDDISGSLQTTSNIIANTRIDYLGINVLDETIILKNIPKAELGNIDYSGVTSSGEKIMGLARFDLEFCKLVPDDILSWSFPSRWSVQDAATIPHAYVTAYYAVVHLARTKPSDTVLVHGGCSAIGLAAISIASTIGCTIFTTVTSDNQKAFLKKQYKFLGDRNILSACNTSFEPHLLMATGGQGAQVILNCVTGSMLNATLRCVAEFGRIIQMGKLDIEENNEIGMNIFLKNVSLIGITPEDIFYAPVDVKKNIRDLIEEGMENLTVRPLYRSVVEHQNVESILKTLKVAEHIGKIVIKLSDNIALGQLNIHNTSQFICDPKGSYLVYGGSSEMWTDVLEWLIVRGARRIVVSSESKPQQAHIIRRLTLLQNYFNAEILLVPTKAHTRDSAAELLSEVYFLGPVGAVFVLPNKNSSNKNSDIKAVHYLDAALKTTAPKALLVNFLSNAAGVCNMRVDAGFPTYNIQWEDVLEFLDVLHTLDNILRFKAKDIFIKTDRFKDVIQETSQSLYKKLNLLLPSSINQLQEETDMAPLEKPDFLQLPSLCSRIIREVPPLFIIPGIFGRNAVKELADQLLYPIFCANYPTTRMSLQEIAAHLVEKMKEIYPRGPYNIVGISYGGILAIEMAKYIEQQKLRIQLYLIDAAPDTIQGILRHLGEGTNNEIGLLCRMLNLTNPDIVKTLSTLSGWESRLKFAVEQYEGSPEDKAYLNKTLTVFKTHLNEICLYQPSAKLVAGPVHILRPSGASKYDICGLLKYCKQNPEINIVEGDHASMLREKQTATHINEKVLC